MKKNYYLTKNLGFSSWKKGRMFVCLLFFFFSIFSLCAQVNYTYGWEPTGLGNWTNSGSADFSRSTTSPCGGTASVRVNFYEDFWGWEYYTDNIFTSPSLGVSNQGDILYSFDYKVVNYSGSATPASYFKIDVQWANSPNGPWTTFYTINSVNHTVSQNCATKTADFTPGGGNVYVRYVSEDLSDGYGDYYIYLDNISAVQGAAPSCMTVSEMTMANIASNTATINWLGTDNATEYEYELRISGDAGSGSVGLVESGTIGSGLLTKTFINLIPSTGYKVYIRANCELNGFSIWSLPVSFYTYQIPALLPYTEDFETDNNWSLINGNQSNKWFVGTAVNNGGSKSLYVSNDNGVTNAFTITNNSYTHAYRDIHIDAGTTNVSVSFDWKAMGEGTTTKYDYLRAWLVPSSFLPVAGETITIQNSGGVRIGGDYNLSDIWNSENFVIDVANYQGQSMRLIFEWLNDSSGGTQPPAAVDNISVVKILCMEPGAVTVSGVTKNTASVSWTASPSTLQGYQYELRTAGQPGSGATGLTASGDLSDISHVFASLTPATQYTVYIRTNCDNTNYSSWTLPVSFTTLCDYPDVLTTTPGTLCGIGTTTLTATTDATGTLRWYTSPASAIPVYTGASFQTPEISETTSYYVAASAGTANDNIYVGTATTASSSLGYSPFAYNWGGYKYQYIYKADELIAAGLTAGPITSLALDAVTAGTSRNDFTIYLGHTTQDAATTTHVSGTTLVYSNASQPVTVGSNQYTFTTPFQWDGVSNVVVQFSWSNNNSGVSSEAAEIRYHVTPFNSLTATYADNKTAAQILATMSGSVDSSGNTLTYANRANMVFNSTCISPRVEVIATVNPAPALELSTTVLEICEGSDSTVVTVTTGVSDYDVYSWEPSTGVTGDAATGWIFNPVQTTAYKLTATQSAGSQCRIQKNITVKVNPQAVFTPLEEEYIVCKDAIQELFYEELSKTEITVGTATTVTGDTDANTAFMNRWTYSKQQYVYTKEELNALGFFHGNITGLSFNITSLGSAATNQNYTIKIKGVTNNTITSSTFVTDGFTTVYGPVTHTHTESGWQNIMFTTPYNWNGESNLLLEIYQEGANSINNAKTYYSTLTNNVGVAQQSGSNATTGTLTTKRLNTKFFINQGEVVWSPATRLYTDEATTVPYVSGEHAAKVYFKRNVNEEQEFLYTATITSSLGCEKTEDITIKVIDVMTPQIQDQLFCDAVSVNDIVVTAEPNATIKWYATAMANEVLTMINTTGTYYVEAERSGCTTERVPALITIVGAQAPTAPETQYFCDSASISDLMVTVNQEFEARWYATVDATTALSTSTDLTNGTTYFASMVHVVSGCESARIPVTAVITPTPSAIPAQAISLCQSTQFGGLQLSAMPNATLKWYASMTATQPISSSLIVTTGTYYVSQIINSCESVRSQIQIAVYAGLERPAANTHNICGSGTVADLTATGAVAGAVYNWYNSATSTTPLALTAALTSGVYYVSQSIEGCESPRRSVTVKIINQTAPVVNAFVLCGSGTVADLYLPTATYVTYRWYATATSTVELAQNVALTTGTYYVARVEHGCVSQRTAVTVTIADLPSSPTGETSQNFTVNTIGEATIADLVMDQTNIVWYITEADAKNGNNALPAEAPLVSGQTYYAVIIGTNGCPSLPTAVTVVITLGMDDFDKTNLVFYPNPTSDILNIRYKNNIDQLVVYNLLGQKVMMQRFDNNEVQLDMSALASGNYLIELHSDNQIQIIKVVRK